MNPRAVFLKVRKEKRNNLTEVESREVLAGYKLPLAASELSKTLSEALKAASKIGYPVVIKAISPQIVHKTDANALIVGIRDSGELEKAHRQLLANVKRSSPNAKIKGVLVQKMVEGGREVIIGGKKDPQFGQVIMFGGGGILTEVMEDVSFRVCPIGAKDAQEMIDETRFSKVLKGYRGLKYDVGSLVKMLVSVSNILQDNQEIAELDINPVMALKKGCVAVDARIVIG
jgi:acyl-CoA synthetase (NDP forming)